MSGRIDLHTHTKMSDGIYSPRELIDYAITRDVFALAITDHDTIAGLAEAMEYAKAIGFNLIPGVELSIDYSGGSFHLIGLNIDFTDIDFLEVTERLKSIRDSRAEKIIDALKENGIEIPIDEVLKEVEDGSIGKPHIARVMMRMGYGESVKEIFKNYMIKGKPGYVKKENISIYEATSIVKKAGGIPIIAHPISLNFSSFGKFESIMKDLIQLGVEGLEVYSPMHSRAEVFGFSKIAQKYNLIISGGSDFHGDKSEEIGSYAEGKFIPVDLFYNILKRNKRMLYTNSLDDRNQHYSS